MGKVRKQIDRIMDSNEPAIQQQQPPPALLIVINNVMCVCFLKSVL